MTPELNPFKKWALVIILNLWVWYFAARILCLLLNSLPR